MRGVATRVRANERTRVLLAALVVGVALAGGLARAQHRAQGEGPSVAHAGAAHGEHAGAAHGEHDGGHDEAHEPHWDYFKLAGQLTNFAIWLTLLYMLLNRVLPKSLAARRAAIVDGLEEARRLKAEAEAKYEEYAKRVERMDEELARVREDVRKAALDERDRIVKEAADKAQRMHAEARFLVEQQMKQLREQLTREAIDAAVAAAETVLRERTGAADQERLVREYVASLRASRARATDAGGAA